MQSRLNNLQNVDPNLTMGGLMGLMQNMQARRRMRQANIGFTPQQIARIPELRYGTDVAEIDDW